MEGGDQGAGSMAQVVEHLLGKHKSLNSTPPGEKKKKREREESQE
jgi:hypothetical protein